MSRLAAIGEKLKETRLGYIIMNLFEQQEKNWPETRLERDEPRTLREVHQEIKKEKEQFIDGNMRRSNRNEYEKRPTPACKKADYYSTPVQGRPNSEKDKKEDKEEEIDTEEILKQIKEDLQNYIRGKDGPFEKLKALSLQVVKATNLVQCIFSVIVANPSFLQAINNSKDKFIKCLFTLSTEGTCKHAEVVEGVNQYVQLRYEYDVEESERLDELMADVYVCGYSEKHYELMDVKLAGGVSETYMARIKLGAKIMQELKKNEVPAKLLKEFFKERMEMMVKKTGEEDIDKEALSIIKDVVGDICF
eukprot:TRINITY_DN9698_c0_g2_i6.p1 TRINITY_DN9698_c0_g2~~TRINITY_DN9698_c0_g2_i6.p1  ORF type:complete len:306 (+),score=73.09 TRINITY_DN9698_c0_g2_i6:1009-1926(+)